MTEKLKQRNSIIIRYNVIGIIMNFILSVSKIIVGIAIYSHAIMLDGFNSLSDMLSSAISILSTVFGAKKATSLHPFGYGRLEYISSLVITIMIMYLGVRSIISSVQSIIDPHEAPRYSVAAVVLLAVSLIGKSVYGVLMRKKGKTINSVIMIMTGAESLGDALVSVSILAAIMVQYFWKIDIEHYLCIIIALLIIYTGLRMIMETMTKILGTKVDPEVKKGIIQLFIKEEAVKNVSNVILHNYGEDVYAGSVNIEVDDKMTAGEISALSRKLIRDAKESGITITAIGVNSVNSDDPEEDRIRDAILKAVVNYKSIIRVHSINIDFSANSIAFYIVQDKNGKEQEKERRNLISEINREFPEMKVDIVSSTY